MNHKILKPWHFRHACKLFDENKRIAQETLLTIIESGRLTPSSFGMEPTRLIVIQSPDLKAALRPHCWNQVQITTASEVVVYLSKKNLRSTNPYVKEMFSRRDLPKEALTKYLEVYGNHLDHHSDEMLTQWAMKQAYLMASSMMTCAAMLDVDSCPIEGFIKEEVEKLLDIDTNEYEVALITTFGYRVNSRSECLRLSHNDMVSFR
jgi:nitroreductase